MEQKVGCKKDAMCFHIITPNMDWAVRKTRLWVRKDRQVLKSRLPKVLGILNTSSFKT